jgi:nucleoside-diphosphate-sugar epimerase
MKEIKLGDLSPTRDFNYVADTCRGFIELAKCDKAIGETVNIGSNYEISIKDTLDLIKNIMQSDVRFITDEQRIRPENSEVFRLWCDNSKIRELTGFEPKYGIREGLEKTVAWFTKPENLKKYKAGVYNV